VTFNTFLLHFRPVRVPVQTIRYTHTFGLGGMSLILVLLLVVTGVLMMFVYEPAPGDAYTSVLRLQESVLFGTMVRSIHYWSANFLIVVVALHLLRVAFTGAFHSPRQFNWIIGLGLLAGVVASNFTGYLLPWDQLSYWAITISTGMLGYVPGVGEWIQRALRGGDEIGQATLITFYTLHTTVLPVFLFVLMGFHFWRVRKAKGVVVPRAPGAELDAQPEKVLGLPFLFMREFVVGLSLVAIVLLLAALASAPLGEAANPGMSPNPAKAPWYFMGLQELLLHFHPVVAVLVLPLGAALSLVAMPYLDYGEDPSGIWFISERGRYLARGAAITAVLSTPLLVVADEWLFPGLGSLLSGLPPSVSEGVVPVFLLALASWAAWRWTRVRQAATRAEAVQAGLVFLTVSFLVLTVIGIWFRGPGMALGWAG
jgi:quinol-cytochrome oxidoreductase complex cytochrome b subunit